MSRFRCIGSDCENTCCNGFLRIAVDKETYKRHKKLSSSDFRSTLLEKVTPSPRGTKAQFGKINMLPRGDCPFLDSDKLCSIQKELGEDYLYYACRNFPRVNNYANGFWERTGKMSCPEAVRLALFDPEALELEESDVSAKEWPVFFRDQIYPEKANNPNMWHSKLRELLAGIVKDRSLPFENRIIRIGIVCDELEKLINNASNSTIIKLIDSINSDFWDKPEINSCNTIANPESQADVFRLLTESTIIPDATTPEYQRCFYELIEGLELAEDHTAEKKAELFSAAFSKHYAPFMQEHPHILENYFISFMMENLFPFGNKLSPSEEYQLLAFRFIFLRLHLVGMSKFNNGMRPELIVRFVQAYAKSMSHNQNHLVEINAFLKEHGRSDINNLM